MSTRIPLPAHPFGYARALSFAALTLLVLMAPPRPAGAAQGGAPAVDGHTPIATVAPSHGQPRARAPFHLDIEVRWPGRSAGEVLHPPALELPAGIEALGMSAEARSEDGDNVLIYRLHLRAAAPGTYRLDAVELPYTLRSGGEPRTLRLAGPTVTVRPAAPLGLRSPALAGTGAVLVLAALATLVWAVRRRALERPRDTPGNDLESYRAALAGARRKGLEGRAAERFLALAELAGRLETGGDGEERWLEAAVERARYGGEPPPASEVTALERRLERRIEELARRQEEAAQPAVALAPTGISVSGGGPGAAPASHVEEER